MTSFTYAFVFLFASSVTLVQYLHVEAGTPNIEANCYGKYQECQMKAENQTGYADYQNCTQKCQTDKCGDGPVTGDCEDAKYNCEINVCNAAYDQTESGQTTKQCDDENDKCLKDCLTENCYSWRKNIGGSNQNCTNEVNTCNGYGPWVSNSNA